MPQNSKSFLEVMKDRLEEEKHSTFQTQAVEVLEDLIAVWLTLYEPRKIDDDVSK